MKRGYREKKYFCGDFLDIQIFPVSAPPRNCTRRQKRKPTSETQARLNEENAKKQLTRLANTNFCRDDYFLTLTYADVNRPDDEEQAKRDIQNFVRRLRRVYKKLGIELKYIWVMERAERTGYIHFHIFLSGGIDRSEIEDIWRLGYANSKKLQFDKNGIAGLVYYATKDKPLTYRRWSGSKNLKKPIERQNDGRITFARAKKLYKAAKINDDYSEFKKLYPRYSEILKNYEIADITPLRNEFNGDYYFYINLYKKDAIYKTQRRRI